ncbi:EF-hand [Cucurbitaria berberidis CBS 394.84]|uniref:EF-hand n=1 Tax=Cucurbitaria berberidis CBS 394.84 TaxID=1168544 RepID=A0A9P4G9L0_9PLEO|nr:EF-hand [Cucurbitaria berberidis CBS 394.84]KAF1841683.1 EF-hand [Cucurbitaria berberidis CBS 394.84]
MSTTPTPYKPSPLSFNSPRQSPFRRPGSIRESSPSTVRPATPGSSPLKPKDTPTTPSQAILRQSATSNASQNAPSWLNTRGTATTPEPLSSPTRNIPSPTRQVSSSTQHTVRALNTASIAAKFDTGREHTPPPLSAQKALSTERLAPIEKAAERPATRPAPLTRGVSSDALSKLPPPLLHSMRESFSVMDRDNDGSVNASDVADMLSQLGLSATPSQLSAYFNGAQSINLATYLNTLSDLLGGLSHANELSAAFEAFDDGDDGQIDLAELKDALLHTAPEPGEKKLTEREIDMVIEGFSGRRAFGKGGKSLGRGEVFRYQEFMSSLTGGGNGGENGEGAAAPA